MATAAIERPAKTLNDAQLKEHLQRLRQPDNLTNWYYLIRSYLILTLVICGAVYFYEHRVEWGLAWAWNLPVTLVAVALVGAVQHQLTVLAHEASHHVLFKNRLLNELASDWLCMFPVCSTTHHYRLHHLAHHQFVNDPERDPNVPQVQVNGHWTHFPMTRAAFWRELGKQLWPLNLILYLKSQAVSNSMPGVRSPYERKVDQSKKKITLAVGGLYVVGLLPLLAGLGAATESTWVVGLGALAAWVTVTAFLLAIPDNWYSQYRVHPTYSMRAISVMRLTFATLLYATLAFLALAYGRFVYYYFLLLWVLPIFTSFSLYMMLRQVVQHSNGDRGWLTNTRVFLVNLLVRDSILPYGQDYHLPHHLYATVPHYRLKDLHELLMGYREYREEAVVVLGAVLSRHEEYPSIIDVLGPNYAPGGHGIHVDDSVLDGETISERDEILNESRASAEKAV